MKADTKYQLILYLFIVVFGTAITGCVSADKKALVKLWMKKSSVRDRAKKNVQFTPPPKYYKKQSHQELDGLWWNKKTNSYISYLSNCPQHIPTLEEIQKETLAQIDDYKIIESRKRNKSLYTILKINHPDNKQTMTATYTFKNRSCFYILNLITQSQNDFRKEKSTFDKFIKGFRG